MDDLLAARSQMAMSLGFHIIFAAIGIANAAVDGHRGVEVAAQQRRRLRSARSMHSGHALTDWLGSALPHKSRSFCWAGGSRSIRIW
jgi:hypothetical protein